MQVTIYPFAVLREVIGRDTLVIELPEGATGSTLWAILCDRYPELEPYRPTTRIARNQQLIIDEEPLSNGDEIALLPPVSGG